MLPRIESAGRDWDYDYISTAIELLTGYYDDGVESDLFPRFALLKISPVDLTRTERH